MKKAKVQVKPIERLQKHVQELVGLIDQLGSSVLAIPVLDKDVEDELLRRCGAKDYHNLVSALNKGLADKAKLHAKRLENKVRYVANDFPAAPGDRVAIVRYEHGWIDCRWSGQVKEAHQSGSGYSYTVTITQMEDGACEPFNIHVDHTRDLVTY